MKKTVDASLNFPFQQLALLSKPQPGQTGLNKTIDLANSAEHFPFTAVYIFPE